MHAQVAFLRKAVTRGDAVGVLSCYSIQGDQITARNGDLQGGAAFQSLLGESFNVPAADLEAVLDRVSSNIEIAYANGRVLVRGGRIKADIPCIDDEPPAVILPSHGWRPIPKGFKEGLAACRPFVNAKLQDFGIRLKDDRLTAISNRAAIEVTLKGLDAVECCLGSACVEFLTSQADDPAEYAQQENEGDVSAIAFRWADGRWLRAQVLSAKFPSEAADRIMPPPDLACCCDMSAEWREAYADASKMTDESIVIHTDRMVVSKGESRIEVDVATDVDGVSYWSAASLDVVVATADCWHPRSWPKPTPFFGPNLRGVVMGNSAPGV